MSQRSSILGLSVLVHVGLAIGIGRIQEKVVHAATAIEIAEVAAKKPPPAAIDPAPVKPSEPAHQPLARRAAAPAPSEAPQQAPSLAAALPDFGLSLSGGVQGSGVALPAGGGALKSPARDAKRAAIPALAPALNTCGESAVKPKPKSVPQPAYTAEASAAGIEGKVRIELTVDELGNVVNVRVLQGLGYGLDEAALAAARQATFEPALACGKPTRATFTISMRFTVG